MQEQTQVVVIGGGIMGCSTAYHLARLGVTDVLLLERSKLSSGTTWHSAAQVRRLRSSASLTKIADNSAKLYARLESETGQATGWSRTGSLSVATHPDRLVHIRRQAALAELFGLNVETVPADAAADLWPLMRRDDIIGAVWSPDDGRVNPSDTVAALTKAARAMGVRICEDRPSRASAATAADCAGWKRRRAWSGAKPPSSAPASGAGRSPHWPACPPRSRRANHFYLLTAPMDGVASHLPTLSDHDGRLYIRDEVGGLLVGCFEADPKLLPLENLPPDFSFDLLNEDWDHFAPIMANAIHRIPALETAGARMLLNGPESFTPDGGFILGESPFLEGLHLGCGMNSVGMASGGGAGMALAEWIVAGGPTMDVSDFDARRFAPLHNTLSLLHARIPETLRGPLCRRLSAPPAPNGPRHPTQPAPQPARRPRGAMGTARELGARRMGSGRATGANPASAGPRGTAAWSPNTWPRSTVPWSSTTPDSASCWSRGPDAETFLQRIAANDVALRPGGVAYTQFLNDRGGIESDLTVHRLDRDRFPARHRFGARGPRRRLAGTAPSRRGGDGHRCDVRMGRHRHRRPGGGRRCSASPPNRTLRRRRRHASARPKSELQRHP